MNNATKEFGAALWPIVRWLLGVLLALGILVGCLATMCAPQIQQQSSYANAWEAFLGGLEGYGKDRETVESTELLPKGSRLVMSGKIEAVSEYGRKTREEVSGVYDLDAQHLIRIKIGDQVVYDRKRDGPIHAER